MQTGSTIVDDQQFNSWGYTKYQTADGTRYIDLWWLDNGERRRIDADAEEWNEMFEEEDCDVTSIFGYTSFEEIWDA